MVEYILLGGFPNNKEMMTFYADKCNLKNRLILEIPHDRYYSNKEIILNLKKQILEIDQKKKYIFILHDFGSIYGKILVEELKLNNVFVQFLSIGPKITLRYHIGLLYIFGMILVYIIYSINQNIGNRLYLYYLNFIFNYENILSINQKYFLRDASMCYLYWNVLFLDHNQEFQIPFNFIRGNTVDSLFDRQFNADIIFDKNHWFFLE